MWIKRMDAWREWEVSEAKKDQIEHCMQSRKSEAEMQALNRRRSKCHGKVSYLPGAGDTVITKAVPPG